MRVLPDDSQAPYAIVIGLDDIRGVHAARTLAWHGIRVIGIARDPKSYGCRTRACQRVLFADTRNEKFVSLLEQLAPTLGRQAVLVPCLDMAVLQISRHRERLERWYPLTLPKPDVVEMMIDKVQFCSFAESAGIPVPKTRFLYCQEDVQHVVETLRFPCCVKPPNSKDPKWLEGTHHKAFKVAGAKELQSIFNTWSHLANPLVVQEWIEGPEDNLFACHCYIGADSEPLATFTSRKLRQWPPETGQACLAEECKDDRVLEITLELFRRVGFRGLGYVEVKRDRNSSQYFIVEPNIGRVSGRMAIAEAGGVELLYTMYCDSLGLPLPENRAQMYGNAKWIYLRQDVQATLSHIRRRNLALGTWWRTWRGRKTFALFSWRDPAPFFADIIGGIRLMVTSSERRKRFMKRTGSESGRSARHSHEGSQVE